MTAADMETCHPNWCPTAQLALGSDPDGKPFDGKQFSCSSIVGMLLFLSNDTQPDVAFAVSQVARFAHDPKESHAAAAKMIVRHLAKTHDKGSIIRPAEKLTSHAHVDADVHVHGPEWALKARKSRSEGD